MAVDDHMAAVDLHAQGFKAQALDIAVDADGEPREPRTTSE